MLVCPVPTCTPRAHELSLFQMHHWLLMAIYDLGPRFLAKRVFLGQEKALGGEMKVGKPALTGGMDTWILNISSHEECLSQEGLFFREIVVWRQTG